MPENWGTGNWTYYTPWQWSTTSSATIQVNTTWENWLSTGTTTYNTTITYPTNQPRGMTAEQIAALERDRMISQEDARRRAREILLEHLTESQREDLTKDNFFLVRSSENRLWRINVGSLIANVDLVEYDDESDLEPLPLLRLASYCAHPAGNMPHDDHHLAQKLALEADEESFVRVANVHYIREGYSQLIPRRRAA